MEAFSEVILKPQELLIASIGQRIEVKLRGGRTLTGILHVSLFFPPLFLSTFCLLFDKRAILLYHAMLLYSSPIAVLTFSFNFAERFFLSTFSTARCLTYCFHTAILQQATDDHMNMVLEDVEEISIKEEENEKVETIEVCTSSSLFFLSFLYMITCYSILLYLLYKRSNNHFNMIFMLQTKRTFKMLFLRGDFIILVSPPKLSVPLRE